LKGNTLEDKLSAVQFFKRVLSQDHVTAPVTIVTDKNPSYYAGKYSVNLPELSFPRRREPIVPAHQSWVSSVSSD
jgi:transposase-like protein